MPVDEAVLVLVRVRQQAVIAALLAPLPCVRRLVEVPPAVGVVVDDGHGPARDGGEDRRLLDQTTQDASATFGGFGEEHATSFVQIGQGEAVQLGVLQLELRLQRPFQS